MSEKLERPSNQRIGEARDTIEDFIDYIQKTEPYAVNSIEALEKALEELNYE